MNKKWQKLLSLAFCTLLIKFSSGFFQKSLANPDLSEYYSRVFEKSRQQLISNFPASAISCIPSNAEGGRLWSKVTTNLGDYYYAAFFVPDLVETVIQVSRGSCRVIIPFNEGGVYPLSNYVEQQLAYQLVIERYRGLIKDVGGLQVFQKILIAEEEPGSINYVFPEDVWAYQQLGLEFPQSERLVVVGSEGIPIRE